MKNLMLCAASLTFALAIQTAASAQCSNCNQSGGRSCALGSVGDSWAQQRAATTPWHGQYSYTQYGQPTALVVPPTARMQTNYSWGVSQNTMMPIYHQYGAAAYPSAGGGFYATPIWPSNTQQFGVYPVRAPW